MSSSEDPHNVAHEDNQHVQPGIPVSMVNITDIDMTKKGIILNMSYCEASRATAGYSSEFNLTLTQVSYLQEVFKHLDASIQRDSASRQWMSAELLYKSECVNSLLTTFSAMLGYACSGAQRDITTPVLLPVSSLAIPILNPVVNTMIPPIAEIVQYHPLAAVNDEVVAVANEVVAVANEIDEAEVVNEVAEVAEVNDEVVNEVAEVAEVNDEVNDEVAKVNDEVNDEVAEVNDEVAEVNDEVAEVNDEVAEVNDEVAEANTNHASSSNHVANKKISKITKPVKTPTARLSRFLNDIEIKVEVNGERDLYSSVCRRVTSSTRTIIRTVNNEAQFSQQHLTSTSAELNMIDMLRKHPYICAKFENSGKCDGNVPFYKWVNDEKKWFKSCNAIHDVDDCLQGFYCPNKKFNCQLFHPSKPLNVCRYSRDNSSCWPNGKSVECRNKLLCGFIHTTEERLKWFSDKIYVQKLIVDLTVRYNRFKVCTSSSSYEAYPVNNDSGYWQSDH